MRIVFVNTATNDVFKAGEQIRTQSALLATLRKLANANDPIAEFYNGSIANDFLKEFNAKGILRLLQLRLSSRVGVVKSC
jgi:gamma-glutamyltranspeptidase